MRPGSQVKGADFVANVLRSPAPLEYYGTPQLWPSSIDIEFAETNFCESNRGEAEALQEHLLYPAMRAVHAPSFHTTWRSCPLPDPGCVTADCQTAPGRTATSARCPTSARPRLPSTSSAPAAATKTTPLPTTYEQTALCHSLSHTLVGCQTMPGHFRLRTMTSAGFGLCCAASCLSLWSCGRWGGVGLL